MKIAFRPALSCLALLTACYGSAPPTPAKIPLPPLVDGATIEVESHPVTTIEQVEKQAKTCSEATPDPQHCTTTAYTEAEPVTRTHTSAAYGGAPISYAQLKVMTDARYEEKRAELADLARVCRRANVPRYLGIAGLLGGLVLASYGAQHDAPAATVAGIVTALGGTASFAAGYFVFGGHDCLEARNLYGKINYADQQSWHDVVGADYAVEIKRLATEFNAEHSRRSPLGMR